MSTTRERFVNFVHEREAIRCRRELGANAPWTNNLILRDYFFCNVNREHDRVTRWIHHHVRKPLGPSVADAVVQLMIARTFNEPETLQWVFPFVSVDSTREIVTLMRGEGINLFRQVYLMVPHGTVGKGQTPEQYFLDAVAEVAKRGPELEKATTLEATAEISMRARGWGAFCANQVCADLRYVPSLKDRWTDWETFILCGPGTRRGLNRFDDLDPKTAAPLRVFTERLLWARDSLRGELSPEIVKHFRDPNNISNCFCEFDKYERARDLINKNLTPKINRYGNTRDKH